MSQDTTIYWGMSQDLIEIHKLHLIQARTPAVDFSPFDSNNRLELTYINPLHSSLLLSFILHLSYHCSSLLNIHYFTFYYNVTTSPPSSADTPHCSCSYYNVTTSPPSSVNTHFRHCPSTPSLLSLLDIYIEEKPSSSLYTPFTKEAKELIIHYPPPQILKMPLSQPSFTTDTNHKRSLRAHRPFLKEAKELIA
jgi:hypothetical protein